MRPIKFRGKRIDNEKWVYGGYCEWSDIKDRKHFQIITGNGHHNEVDPKTVGQSTGLSDKNDKEIYKGDIVKHSKYAYSPFENSISVVEWFDENYEYIFKKRHIKKDDNDPQVYNIERLGNAGGGVGKEFYPEVIGNIHENPELLK